jgi:hypothetical protein
VQTIEWLQCLLPLLRGDSIAGILHAQLHVIWCRRRAQDHRRATVFECVLYQIEHNLLHRLDGNGLHFEHLAFDTQPRVRSRPFSEARPTQSPERSRVR